MLCPLQAEQIWQKETRLSMNHLRAETLYTYFQIAVKLVFTSDSYWTFLDSHPNVDITTGYASHSKNLYFWLLILKGIYRSISGTDVLHFWCQIWIRQTIFQSFDLIWSGLIWFYEVHFWSGRCAGTRNFSSLYFRHLHTTTRGGRAGAWAQNSFCRWAELLLEPCCCKHCGAAQELLTPAFPVAAEPEAGAVPDSRLWLLWESRSPCQGTWCQRGPSPPACLSSCSHYWAQPAPEADVTTCS